MSVESSVNQNKQKQLAWNRAATSRTKSPKRFSARLPRATKAAIPLRGAMHFSHLSATASEWWREEGDESGQQERGNEHLYVVERYKCDDTSLCVCLWLHICWGYFCVYIVIYILMYGSVLQNKQSYYQPCSSAHISLWVHTQTHNHTTTRGSLGGKQGSTTSQC